MKRKPRWNYRITTKDLFCPSCQSKLARAKYEGMPVWYCTKCRGHFLERHSAEGIKRRTQASQERLEQETSHYKDKDEKANVLRCPKCRAVMTKKEERGAIRICVDECKDCDCIWFDPGELAFFQLAYEYSKKGMQTVAMQRRLKNMSPARKRRLEYLMNSLPSKSYDYSGELYSAAEEIIDRYGGWRYKIYFPDV